MTPFSIIERKRDGHALTAEEIAYFIAELSARRIPDYQTAAWLMAIVCRGMDAAETAALTDAMLRSGTTLDLSDSPRPTADKHSTGGIGDKISIPLAPLCAAAGLTVPMIAGRGLGITGGTIDKLESISGYRTDIPLDRFRAQIYDDATRCGIITQSAQIAPADKILYALRDVTATVNSIPLITASIMSKKLAEGAKTLLFDVKYGQGAFMPTAQDAEQLAQSLITTARRLGRNAAALITDMNTPLGATAGNALEIQESLDILNGKGPADVRTLTLACASHMLRLSDITLTDAQLAQHLDDGTALRYYHAMIKAQGGNPDAPLPKANIIQPLPSPADGYVNTLPARAIGLAVIELGGGRKQLTDTIDPAVGIADMLHPGTPVKRGQPLLTLHANDPAKLTAALDLLQNAITITPQPPTPTPLIYKEVI